MSGTGTFGYGLCPQCGADGVSRERRPDGNDTCIFGHVYPSKDAVAAVRPTAPASADVEAIRARCEAATAETEACLKRSPGKCAGGIILQNQPCSRCGLGPQDGACPYDIGSLGTREFAEHALGDVAALLSALTAALAEGERLNKLIADAQPYRKKMEAIVANATHHAEQRLFALRDSDHELGLANDRIATLTTQLSEAQAALKPFANAWIEWNDPGNEGTVDSFCGENLPNEAWERAAQSSAEKET